MADTNSRVIIDVSINSEDAKAKSDALAVSIKAIKQEQKELKAANEETSTAYVANAQQLRQLAAEQKSYITISQAAEGSNNQLRAQLALLTQQYNALSSSERDGTTAGKALQIQIKSISDTLKTNESAVGDNRRNVGNYKDALAGANQTLAEQKSQLSAVTQALPQSSIGFKLLGDTVERTKNQVQNFRQAQTEAKESQEAFKEAQQIATQATKAANEATEKATQIGFQFSKGKATQAQVEAATAAATDATTVATAAQTAATEAQTVATGAATNAAKVFRVALASTGIGAIIILVVALVSYLSKFDPIMDRVEQAFAAVGSVVTRVTDIFVQFVSNIRSFQDLAQKLGQFLLNPIDSFKKLGAEIRDVAAAAVELTKAQQDLEDQVKIQELSNARAIQQVKQLTIQAKNRSLSEQERQKLLTKANQIDEDNFKRQKQIADEKARIAYADIKLNANLTDQEIDQIKKRGLAAAFEIKDRKRLTDEQLDAVKDAQLEQIKNEEEFYNRQEKRQNAADALAEKRAADEEKRQARIKAAREKTDEAERARVESAIATASFNQNERDKDLAAVDREIAEKKEKYKAYGETVNQLEKERLARRNQINLQYEAQAKKDTEAALHATQDLFIANITNQNDREISQIYVQNQRKLKAQDELIEATKIRIELGEQGLTELLLAQQNQRDAILSNNQAQIDAKNFEIENELQSRKLEREKSIKDARQKIREEEQKNMDDALGFLQANFDKSTAIGKLAFFAEKAFAVARIVTQTQVALAANRTAEQVQNAIYSAIPVIGAALAIANSVVKQAERTRLNISAGIGIASVVATTVAGFKDGVIGFNSDGGGSIVRGKGSSTSDSINARLSNGESVINAKSTSMFAPLLSAINQAGGGRALSPGFAMAQGGFVSGITQRVQSSTDQYNLILEAAKNITVVTDVKDIIREERTYNKSVVNATI